MKDLASRLKVCGKFLDSLRVLVEKHPALNPEVAEHFRVELDCTKILENLSRLLDARKIAFDVLKSLGREQNGDGKVPWGGSFVDFHIARILAMQGYLAVKWAIADNVVRMIGRTICTTSVGKNQGQPPNLLTQFVRESRKSSTCGTFFKSISRIYGWPIAVSYVFRNTFLHEGDRIDGWDIFDGLSVASSFKLSEASWMAIEEEAKKKHESDPSFIREEADWPENPSEDARKVLAACENEIDEALGVLLFSATGLLKAHISSLLGDD